MNYQRNVIAKGEPFNVNLIQKSDKRPEYEYPRSSMNSM